MALQQGAGLRVWGPAGRAWAGELGLRLDGRTANDTAVSRDLGDVSVIRDPATGARIWHVDSDAAESAGEDWVGGDFVLKLFRKGRLVDAVREVTFGNVYLCSGQSNMRLGIEFDLAYNEVAAEFASGRLDHLRFTVFGGGAAVNRGNLRRARGKPRSVFQMWQRSSIGRGPSRVKWLVPSMIAKRRQGVGGLSAVCAGMGIALAQANPHMPVGLVVAAVDSSGVASWMPGRDVVLARNELEKEGSHHRDDIQALLGRATSENFEAYLLPLQEFAFRRAVYYQGEADVEYPEIYKVAMRHLVQGWRRAFAAPELPFTIVTLAMPSSGKRGTMAHMRAVQAGLADELPSLQVVHSFDLQDPFVRLKGCANSDKAKCCVREGRLQVLQPGNQCLSNTALCDPKDGLLFGGLCHSMKGVRVLARSHLLHPRTKQMIGRRAALSDQGVRHPRVAKCEARANAVLVTFDLFSSGVTLDVLPRSSRNVTGLELDHCDSTRTGVSAEMCACLFWKPDGSCASNPALGTHPVSPFRQLRDDVTFMDHDQSKQQATVRIPLSDARAGFQAVRFAWSDSPCCDLDSSRALDGTMLCSPLNCGLLSAPHRMVPQPFVLHLDRGACSPAVH